MTKTIAFALLTAWCSAALFLDVTAARSSLLHAPHDPAHGLSCASCHAYPLGGEVWPPDFPPASPTIDDTLRNFICLRCHDGSVDAPDEIAAPVKGMHSALAIGGRYANWTTQCVDCHSPHFQAQLHYRDLSPGPWLVRGTVTGVETGAGDPGAALSTITYTVGNVAPGWEDPASWAAKNGPDRGLIFAAEDQAGNLVTYEVLAATTDTITLQGAAPGLTAGQSFGLLYGQLLRPRIQTPANETREVRFFTPYGGFTEADGPLPPQGICQVCHTRTRYWRNDGTATTHHPGERCTICHALAAGFAHGAGSGGEGTGCGDCHGKDAANGGHGTTQSHSTHTESDDDDARGPAIACDACHYLGAFPFFRSGTDQDGDGRISLAETDVCDPCHSPGGSYDGVNDPVFGAKANWRSGIYTSDGKNLQPGKDKWCASCHDESPSVVRGISAPNVVGDEDGSALYGKGWGYYRSGHGLPSSATYPASGGVTAGAGLGCDACHDPTAPHVDGLARTFNDGDLASLDPAAYRQGYRFRLMGNGEGSGSSGREPMMVPRPQNTGNDPRQYALCASCHPPSPAFLSQEDLSATNLVTTARDGTRNRHAYHLDINGLHWAADWEGGQNSRITCVSCHNVHGTTRLAMLRDGRLTGRTPGLQIWYKNDATTIVNTGNPDPPWPADIPLPASDGTIWIGASSGNLCSHCHGSPNTVPEDRLPFQDVRQRPVLIWSGENGFLNDGVEPDSGPGGSTFTFRVLYRDMNNDPPRRMELLLDANDNGVYESNERFPMTATDLTDTDRTDGMVYTLSLPVNTAGDGRLSYRFSAADDLGEATGEATAGGVVVVLDSPPELSWAGPPAFATDGVEPDKGGTGVTYEFRVRYRDADGEPPTTIEVWVDENDNGSFEDGEKHPLVMAGAGNPAEGVVYRLSRILHHRGDGGILYRFYAANATAEAHGPPTATHLVTVLPTPNSPPVLAWEKTTCASEGVRPPVGLATGVFEFLVRYTDPDNTPPATIEVWVDTNDNGSYEADEKHPLAPKGGDGDYQDGEPFATTLALDYAGDGRLQYRFFASDGADPAWGDATSDHTLTVISTQKAVGVRPGDGEQGPVWYNSITAAFNAAPDAGLVLVYPAADFSPAVYNEEVMLHSRANRTIRSLCGPALTALTGATYGVRFDWSDNTTLEGFDISGAAYGVYINGGSPVTIRNCRIHDNTVRGVYTANSATALTLAASEITANGDTESGAGLYLKGGPHTITDTVIHNNGTASTGGAIRLDWTAVGTTLMNVTIRNNSANGLGGGLYVNGGKAHLKRCTIYGNTSADSGGGMYVTAGNSSVTLENTVFAANQADRGGAVFVNGGLTSFTNVTVADNRAANDGGGLYLNCVTTTIQNAIFWNNLAGSRGHNVFKGCGGGDAGVVSFSDMSTVTGLVDGGHFTGEGNIDPALDPFFAGPDDYHLRHGSPAIDRASAGPAPDEDIDGEPRPQGAGVDMGADEYRGP